MGAAVTVYRILEPGDEAALEAFLLRHAASSMFLRSNARLAGLADHGEPFQGTYAAAFDGADIVAVVGHFWNGNIILQAPDHLEALLGLVVSQSGRKVKGIVGPWEQANAARRQLGLDTEAAHLFSREILMSLALDRLVVPEPLAGGRVQCRKPRKDEAEWLTVCRRDYQIEAVGRTDGPDLLEECREETRRDYADWTVLTDGASPLACTRFNARLPDTVQVGGVFTPPDLRGRGYARAAVAGSLLAARG
jgi:predicted GNAT family acetyltransferase